MTTTISDYTAKINQEIKDKKLTSKDNEYYKLKMREMYHRRYAQKEICEGCGKLLTYRTIAFRHKCKNVLKSAENVI